MEAGQTGAQVGTAAAGFTYKGALKFSGWKARTFPFPERQVSDKASRDEPESMFFHSTDGLGPAHALLWLSHCESLRLPHWMLPICAKEDGERAWELL